MISAFIQFSNIDHPNKEGRKEGSKACIKAMKNAFMFRVASCVQYDTRDFVSHEKKEEIEEKGEQDGGNGVGH